MSNMTKLQESLVEECMNLSIENGSSIVKDVNVAKGKKKKTKTSNKKEKKPKEHKEPKINQKYNQSVNPSKRHRDRLNSELDNLAKLLPFPEDVIARLDKLSILRLSVSFLRNKNFFKGAVNDKKDSTAKGKTEVTASKNDNRFNHFLNKALDGFILVVTVDGEIFFASESVKDYLGYSQSSVLHQSLETFVHNDDKDELLLYIKSISSKKIVELDENNQDLMDDDMFKKEHEFIVRLKSVLNNGTSDMYKPFKITGRIRKLNMQQDIVNLKYALFATCTPARTSVSVLEIRMKSTLFCSKNRIDLSFLDLDARGKEYFGYSKKDIFGRSSYVMVHRLDVQHVRCKHTEIVTCGKTSIGTFRLKNKNNEWNWLSGYGRVLYKNGKPDYMVTTNRVLSEEEGRAMMKLRDEADRKALEALGLVEPEEESKALELGFPKRHPGPMSASLSTSSADEEGIPMPLGNFLEGLAQNPPDFEKVGAAGMPFDTKMITDDRVPLSDNTSNNAPDELENSPRSPIGGNSVLSIKAEAHSPLSDYNLPIELQQALSVASGESAHSPLPSNIPQQQQTPSDLFQTNTASTHQFSSFDLPLDYDTMMSTQPPPQPRFSFLPPVSFNQTNAQTPMQQNRLPENLQQQSPSLFSPNIAQHGGGGGHNMVRAQTYEQMVGPNVALAPPSDYMFHHHHSINTQHQPFMPHLIDNNYMAQHNGTIDWARQNEFSNTSSMFHFLNNSNTSPSSSDAHSVHSGGAQTGVQFNNYPPTTPIP
uniref:Ahr-b n=1 Tax=Clytia hemisphaerica TaxID=252671 RepID=A0A0N7I758_9CNID|nr:Ahr-b [Clytia hemisphaerica]